MERLRTGPVFVVALLLTAGLSATVAAGHRDGPTYRRCYETDCSWTRSDEANLQRRAERSGRMDARPGDPVAGSAEALFGEDYLALNRTDDGLSVTWDLNATGSCGPLVHADNLTVPGYEDAVQVLPSSPHVTVDGRSNTSANRTVDPANATLGVTTCGTIRVDAPSPSETTPNSAQLRMQTGQPVDARFRLNGTNTTFPFWTGLVTTATLSVDRDGPTLRVDLAVQVRLLVEGDLGWGSGTVLVDGFAAPYRRSVALVPEQTVGRCDVHVEGGPAEVRVDDLGACYDVQRRVRSVGIEADRTGPIPGPSPGDELPDEETDPSRRCRSSVVLSYLLDCRVVAHLQALPGLAKAHLDDAAKESVRVDRHADVAARLVRNCADLRFRNCADGGAAAVLAWGSAAEPVPVTTDEEAIRRHVRTLVADAVAEPADQRLADLLASVGAGRLVDEVARCWLHSAVGGTGPCGGAS